METARTRSSQLGFLDIPAEIRLLIYEYLYPPTLPTLYPRSTADTLGITLTCRLIHSECRDFAYSRSIWNIYTTQSMGLIAKRRSRLLKDGIGHLPRTDLRLITHITMDQYTYFKFMDRENRWTLMIGDWLPHVQVVAIKRNVFTQLNAPGNILGGFRMLRLLIVTEENPKSTRIWKRPRNIVTQFFGARRAVEEHGGVVDHFLPGHQIEGDKYTGGRACIGLSWKDDAAEKGEEIGKIVKHVHVWFCAEVDGPDRASRPWNNQCLGRKSMPVDPDYDI